MATNKKSGISRRNFLQSTGVGALALTSTGLAAGPLFDSAKTAVKGLGPANSKPTSERDSNVLVVNDGTKIYYKDWGTGPAVFFSHGWPLNADAWDAQMLFLAERGYRVIAHDRRGHGRSSQPWSGNDMDTYADDLAQLVQSLDIDKFTMIGHSTGGGEIARYVGRYGTKRIKKAVLIAAVPPIMLKTSSNPGGLSMSVFDGLRASVRADRSEFFRNLAIPFFGFNSPGSKPIQGVIESFWSQGMLSSIKASYDCIKQFSETDFTGDLKRFTMPTLILQGDADQIVPFADSGKLQSQLIPKATLKVYAGAPHGLCVTHADKVNADLLSFLES